MISLNVMTSFIETVKTAYLEVGEFIQWTSDPCIKYSIEFQLRESTIKYISDCERGPWAVHWSENSNVKYYVEPEKLYQAMGILQPSFDEAGILNEETCTIEP